MSKPPPLTPLILKALPFTFQIHVNGGSKFSKRISTNEEYGLSLCEETNGSPNFRRTARTLSGPHDCPPLDLLHGIPDYEAFCGGYNAVIKANQ